MKDKNWLLVNTVHLCIESCVFCDVTAIFCLFHESTISAIYMKSNCKERFSLSITVTIKAIYVRQFNLPSFAILLIRPWVRKMTA